MKVIADLHIHSRYSMAISEDPKERERHNSIVMAEYNRLTSQHNFYKAGLKDGIEKRNGKTEKKME